MLGAYALKMHQKLGYKSEEELAMRIRQYALLSPWIKGSLYFTAACLIPSKDLWIFWAAGHFLRFFVRWKGQGDEENWLTDLILVANLLDAIRDVGLSGYGQIYCWREGVTGGEGFKMLYERFGTPYEENWSACLGTSVGTLFFYRLADGIITTAELRHRGKDPLKYASLNAALGVIQLGCVFFASRGIC
jgi:hypothetical protein